MKTIDLLRMCRENLFRRKARTFLSVLGVVIGCCSILLMLSIGVGLNASNEAWLSEMGDLTKIDVFAYSENGNTEMKLDEEAVRSFRNTEHVQTVIPKYGTNEQLRFRVVCGNNERYRVDFLNLVGIDPDILSEAGYTVQDGHAPDRMDTALMGQYFEYTLLDSRKPEGRNQIQYYEYLYGESQEEMPDPYQKLVGQKITLQALDEDEKVVYTKELTISGKLEENYSAGYETTEGLVLRADDLQRIVKETNKALGIKQKGSLISSVSVMADDIKNVTAVEDAIHEIGYQTSSMASMRESTEKEMANIQLILGGIGAVSLLVAAIGIINTMIMSVSERTKEIGIMKAIGCYVRDIRKLFLMESAAIGLLGGVIGSVLSFIISCIINLVAAGMNEYTEESQTFFETMFTSPTRTSIIPLWLFLFGMTFSVLIGLIAGFYPANKAVKISALEAMKNE
ncbi:MAG: ABC transporter permease [Clostridia bacterium]|nr:ABC transporter permease [Clostridia bacterium]